MRQAGGLLRVRAGRREPSFCAPALLRQTDGALAPADYAGEPASGLEICAGRRGGRSRQPAHT
ncbi:MAG: hypothetical protein ACK55Z_25180, partial [bacterium]